MPTQPPTLPPAHGPRTEAPFVGGTPVAAPEPIKPPEPVERFKTEMSSHTFAISMPDVSDTKSYFGKEKRFSSQEFVLFDYAPGVYSVHKRVSRLNEALAARPFNTHISVLSGDYVSLGEGEAVLVPMPQGQEEIKLGFGDLRIRREAEEQPSFVIKEFGSGGTSKIFALNDRGQQVGEVGVNSLALATQQVIYHTTIKETTYPDGSQPTKVEQVGPSKEDKKQPKKAGVVTVVTAANGKKYLLIEGDTEKVSISVSEGIANRAKQELNPQREYMYGNASVGLATQADERHPNRNEDVVDFYNGVYMLLDGMGGEGAEGDGYRASRMALSVIKSVLSSMPANANIEQVKAKLVEAIHFADKAVTENLPTGGGATVVLAKQVGNKVAYAKVGDSKFAVFDGETFTFETSDDSYVNAWQEHAKTHGGIVPFGGDAFGDYIQARYQRGMFVENLKSFAQDAKSYGYELVVDGSSVKIRLDDARFAEIKRDVSVVSDKAKLDPVKGYAFHIRNYISAAVGGGLKKELKVDSGIVDTRRGQRFVLDSDGVGDVPTRVQQIDVLTMTSRKQPAEQAAALVHLADDISTGAINSAGNEFHSISLPGQETHKKKDDRSAIVGIAA